MIKRNIDITSEGGEILKKKSRNYHPPLCMDVDYFGSFNTRGCEKQERDWNIRHTEVCYDYDKYECTVFRTIGVYFYTHQE